MALHTVESGTQGAPSILYLHGAGTGSWMWQELTENLPEFHNINVDLPGQSHSNHRHWKSLADTANQLADIIRERATNGRAHVVGLSLGGYTALELIIQVPELVDHAIVSGVTVTPLSGSFFTFLSLRLTTRMMRERWFANAQARYVMRLPAEIATLYTDSVMMMSTETYRAITDEVFHYRLPDEALARSSVPLLVTAGGAEMSAIKDSVRYIPSVMPTAKGVIARGLHHGWNGEDPELFTAMVRAWITDTPLPEKLQTQI